MENFSDLPLVVLRKLFKLITNPDDLVSCSRVCKNWQAAYQTMPKPDALYLHFEEFLPLNHRLFYTNEPVARSCFLKVFDDLQFLQSDTAHTHFVSIRKLVIFPSYGGRRLRLRMCKFSFQNQLNHLKSLEHLEIHSWCLVLKDHEIDLPRLNILQFERCEFNKKNVLITLRTPCLVVLRIYPWLSDRSVQIANFKFLFSHQLKHLAMIHPGKRFTFEFPCLQYLIIGTNQSFDRHRRIRSLNDRFLEKLPSLKFLFARVDSVDFPKLSEQKLKFKLNDLKILDYEEYPTFNYTNWQQYVQHREQLRYWPSEFEIVFGWLINCGIPLHHFEENYLQIFDLSVGHSSDPSLLAAFLGKVNIKSLTLHYEFNLTQSLLDKVAYFQTLEYLDSYESTWKEIGDLTPLSRWNIYEVNFHFQQLPHQVAIALLKNPFCSVVEFYGHTGGFDETPSFSCHRIEKKKNKIYCATCKVTRVNDPDCSKDLIAGIVRHIESPRRSTNFD